MPANYFCKSIRRTTSGCLIWVLAALSPLHAERLTIERLFAAPDLSGPTLRSPSFSPDGKLVAYLKGRADNKDRYDLWAYDIARRQHRRLIDAAVLAPQESAPTAEEAQRRERQRTAALAGIVEYQFASDSKSILVPLNGDLYLYQLGAPAERAVRRLTNSTEYETDARFSPRGHYVSFVRERNLYVLDLANGRERVLTRSTSALITFGTAEFIAQEEMDRDRGYWWSPDESRIAYTRVDESGVDALQRFEIGADKVQVITQRYPATGRPNAVVQLLVAAIADSGATAAPLAVDLGANTDTYLPRVDWFPDSRYLAVQQQSRDQHNLSLLRVDARTGRSKELLREHSDTWVPLNDDLTFLKQSPRFIWSSQRSGYKHLYLYDLDGRLIRPLTHGDWMVVGDGRESALCAVDETTGRFYFVANRDTPIERHLYRASLSGPMAEPQRLTQQSGWHSITIAAAGSVFLDSYSSPNNPPEVTLRRIDGKALRVLLPNALDTNHPYAKYLDAHQAPEFGALRAADGQTLFYQLTKPHDFVAGKRYPVIVDVYGGPGVQRVRRAWGNLFQQLLTQSGYVVFTLDNRGSGFRGTAFESTSFGKLGSVEVADQVTGVEFLRSLPYVDSKRIGVFGWSYGGYMALMCMTRAADYFTTGVAGAPVTDWRLYDTHYTERYMGTPANNASGYAESNVLAHLDRLRGPLLLVHGMADDNVLFTNSTALMSELQKLGKPFDVMVYPGSKHGLLRQQVVGPHAYASILRFLDRNLQ